MQSANLSTEQVNKYLDLLMRNGYIIVDGRLYKPTSRGLELLENLQTEYLKLKVRVWHNNQIKISKNTSTLFSRQPLLF